MKKNNPSKRYKVSKKILEMFKEHGITEENRTYDLRCPFSHIKRNFYESNKNKSGVLYSANIHCTGNMIFRYISYTDTNTGDHIFELDSWTSSYPYLNYHLAQSFLTHYLNTKALIDDRNAEEKKEKESRVLELERDISEPKTKKLDNDYEMEM